MNNNTKKVNIRQFVTFQGDKWYAPEAWNDYAENLIRQGNEISNVKLEKHWTSADYPNADYPRNQDYAIISYDITKLISL